MIVARHTCYLSEDGGIHLDPRSAAVADAAWWWRTRQLPGRTVSEQSAGDAVISGLQMHPIIAEQIMAQYQAALDDAERGKHNADKKKES